MTLHERRGWGPGALVAAAGWATSGCKPLLGAADGIAEAIALTVLVMLVAAVAMEVALVVGLCVTRPRGARIVLGLVAVAVGCSHGGWIVMTAWESELLPRSARWFFGSLAPAASAAAVGVFAIALHWLEDRTFRRWMVGFAVAASVLASLVVVRGLGARDPQRFVATSAVVAVEVDGCALHRDGQVSCALLPAPEPWLTIDGVAEARSLAKGSHGSRGCVVDAGGALRCWGLRLVSGPTPQSRPIATLIAHDVASVAGFVEPMSSTLRGVGVVFLSTEGRAMIHDDAGIRQVDAGLPGFDALALLGRRGCGVHLGGAAVTCWQWPSNERGRLWIEAPIPSPTPAVGLSLGSVGGCVLTRLGSVACWRDDVMSPVEGLDQVDEIAAGSDHTCALLRDRTVRCWGDNDLGQLGVGDREPRNAVRATSLPSPVLDLSADDDLTCAVSESSEVLCWGRVEPWRLEEPRRAQICRRSSLFPNTSCIPAPARLRGVGAASNP